MVREEFVAHAKRHMPRTPGGFYPPSSAEPSPPPSPPRASEKRPTPSAGCLVANCEELKTWVLNNMPRMIEQGKRFNTNVYKELQRTLLEDLSGRRTTLAIIPVDDHANMTRMIELYFATSEERGSPVLRIRALFDGVNVLIGDFNVTPVTRTQNMN